MIKNIENPQLPIHPSLFSKEVSIILNILETNLSNAEMKIFCRFQIIKIALKTKIMNSNKF